MENSDDLDRFFAKKDQKGKKQPKVLTNNEELLKRLAIVTSATTAFKENMDLNDEDVNDSRHGFVDENLREPVDENNVYPNQKVKITSNQKTNPVTQNTFLSGEKVSTNQDDDWENFTDGRDRYDQIRLKLNPNVGDHDRSDYDDDDDEDFNNGHDEQINHENSTNSSKEKHVWKVNEIQSSTSDEKAEEKSVVVKEETVEVKSTSVYRPPQLRSKTGQTATVTVVSGVHQRATKKEKPNLASTEDFPTLGKTMNKK